MIDLILFALVVIAQAADVYTTNQALKRPGAVEANKVVAFLMDKLGGFWWLVKAPVVLAVGALFLTDNAGAVPLSCAIIVGHGFIAYNNYRISRGR